MKLALSVDSVSMIRCWVDASYNNHDDFKGHTGAMMYVGKEDVLRNLIKKKFNIRISTEGEMVGANYMLGYVLWGEYFTESLGYTVHINVLFQDNKLTMVLENNDGISNGKRNKYIKDSYFLIVD